MKHAYFIRRLIMFFIVVILAATLNFIIPRMAPGDPIGAVLEELRARGAGTQADSEDEIVAAYRARFGLDKPIHMQYLSFLFNTLRFDLGYSISYYPQKVEGALLRSLPWTVGLLAISTVISFAAGSFFGAMMALAPRARLHAAIRPHVYGAVGGALLFAGAYPGLHIRLCLAAAALGRRVFVWHFAAP